MQLTMIWIASATGLSIFFTVRFQFLIFYKFAKLEAFFCNVTMGYCLQTDGQKMHFFQL